MSQLRFTQEQENALSVPIVQSGLKYSFHNKSLFARYLGMGLKSKSLLPFVQKPDCKHSFGCLEHLIRKLAYNTGLYFIAKYMFEAVAPNEWTVSELVSVASS
jgi:hypothetical protein